MASLTTAKPCLARNSMLSLRRLVRHYSATPSLIETQDIPAPHCGHIRILRLNRPQARNAISRRLLADLASELARLDCGAKQTRALVLGSAVPGVFCAGADLKERQTFTLDDTRTFLTSLRATLTTLATLPIPTVAAIPGPALGGGLELALATTFRVASTTAPLGLPETRLGIIPGAGGTFRLPALVGLQRARWLVLSGARIAGARALEMGLVDRVCAVDEGIEAAAEDEAVRMAREVCEGGPLAVLQAVSALQGWQAGESAENAAYEGLLHSTDRLEALAAFREKRAPRFKGE